MYESDINPIPPTNQVKIIPPKMLKLNIAFFDIETDFDPEKGFADPADPLCHYSSVYLQWMETMICLAVPSRHLQWIRQRKNLKV